MNQERWVVAGSAAWLALVMILPGWGGALGRFGEPWNEGPMPALVLACAGAVVGTCLGLVLNRWSRRPL